MTTQPRTPPASHTIAPPRSQLARLVGRTVKCEAHYGNVCWQFPDGKCLYYTYSVHVYPSATLDHVWIDIPARARRQLYEGTCFSFDGEVIRYERADKSFDYGLLYVGGLNVNRG